MPKFECPNHGGQTLGKWIVHDGFAGPKWASECWVQWDERSRRFRPPALYYDVLPPLILDHPPRQWDSIPIRLSAQTSHVEGDNKPSALWKLITGNYETSRLFFWQPSRLFLTGLFERLGRTQISNSSALLDQHPLIGQNMKRAFLYSLRTDWLLFWRLHHACAAATPQPLPI